MTKLTRASLKSLSDAILAAVQQVAEDHGVEIALGAGSFTETNFSLKLEGKLKGALSLEAQFYDDNRARYRLPPRGTEFTIGSEVYVTTGLKSRGKNCVLIQRKSDGAAFVCPPSQVPSEERKPTMPLADFVKAVNDLDKAQCEAINKKGGPFGAMHVEFPEVMLKHYHEQGLTPQETLDAIAAENEAEMRAEARAS